MDSAWAFELNKNNGSEIEVKYNLCLAPFIYLLTTGSLII